MTKEDFIREFVLKWAAQLQAEGESVESVVKIAKQYAKELYPVEPLAKHRDICKILRYVNFKELASENTPLEDKYKMLSDCLDKELSTSELNLYSYLL